MTPTYEQILEIMHGTMAEVTVAGHDIKRCIWELSPSIRNTLEDRLRRDFDSTDGTVSTFNGIPIRKGVTDEGTGILLKMVNPNQWE